MITTSTIFNNIILYSYWILIVLVTFKILIKRRTIPSSMAWLLIIYIVPLIGIIAYLLLGETYLDRKRTARTKVAWTTTIHYIKQLKTYKHIFSAKNSDIAAPLFKFCEHRQGIGALTYNQIQLFKKTDDIVTSLIKDIECAKNSIDMIFYIWKPGGLVNQITKKLVIAAKRGVHCRLILDSVGCTSFFNSTYPKIMRKAGVKIVEALHINPLRIFLRRIDVRQHRKIILIDEYITYTGSMNMVDPSFSQTYLGIRKKWIDLMVRINGPISSIMSVMFASDWKIETGEHIFPTLSLDTYIYPKIQPLPLLPTHTIQMIPSGPELPENIIHQVLLISLYTAREQLIITTPYLVPSDDILYAICTAAQRGVEVHIIIPQENDSILVNWASRAFFSELLEAGVQIHQFQHGLLHTKSILIDQQLSLIGTVNLDIRSLWLNFEITLLIDSKNFSNDLKKIQYHYISHSTLIDPKKWAQRPYWERIIERLFYFLSPLL